jgi:hypothetical protein
VVADATKKHEKKMQDERSECPSLSADWIHVGEWVIEDLGELDVNPRAIETIRQMARICAETNRLFDGLAGQRPPRS